MTVRQETLSCPEVPQSQEEKALFNEGFGYLAPLLDPRRESELVRSLTSFALQPGASTPESRALFRQYHLGLEIIPAERLFGFCGQKEKEIVPTALGRCLASLCLHRRDVSLFLIDGAAREVLEIKPPSKTRPQSSDVRSWHPSMLKHWLKQTHPYWQFWDAPPPGTDLDICLTTPNPHSSLEGIAQDLRRGEFRDRKKGGVIKVVQSKRRPGFQRIDMTTTGYLEPRPRAWMPTVKRKGPLFANIAFPEGYTAESRLLHHLLSRNVLDSTPILIIPIRDDSGSLVSFRGVAIDFFDYRQYLQRAKFQQFFPLEPDQKMPDAAERSLSLALYRWPEFAFPKKLAPERFAHFLKEFQNWAWNNSLPMMEINMEINPPKEYGWQKYFYRVSQIEDMKVLRTLARRSCYWFYQEIIKPLAQDPSLLGNPEIQKDNAEELLLALKSAFNGDPFLTTIRCLTPEKTVSDVPASGMGIFAKDGLFPCLGDFLEQKGKRGYPRWQTLLATMEICPFGPAKMGWRTLFDFLYKESDGSLLKVAELLTPAIWPGTTKDFLKDFLGKFEPEFGPIAYAPRATKKDLIEKLLCQAQEPLTTAQVAELAEISQSQAYAILVQLSEKGQVVKIGGRRKKRGIQQDMGTGGHRALWALSQVAEKFSSPTTEALVLKAIKEGVKTIPGIAEATGLKEQTVRLRIRMLQESSRIDIITHPYRRRKNQNGTFPRLEISLVQQPPTEPAL